MVFGQKATFSADSSNYDGYYGKLNWTWKINGKKFSFGSKPVEITIKKTSTFDTIFFRESDTSKWISILCKIKSPDKFIFTYNECCGGFYLTQKNNGIVTGSLKFELSESKPSSSYLIEFGDYSVILDSTKSEVILNGSRGAMDPNTYLLKISEIQIANQLDNEINQTVLYYNGIEETIYFKVIKEIIDSIYQPLSDTPILIQLNTSNLQIKVE